MVEVAYLLAGVVLAWFTRHQRRDEDTVLWVFERVLGWPFFACAVGVARVQAFRRAVGTQINKRPPRWYDFLFFWALF
jgi:hypothetical protein